ncbi:hypothetical protein [Paludisphaera mucosa]|uniref:PEP-CTERM protein-sorting domain-containing protein n=1 Tax=Paludisphaera mucosa TaxID=3030827 RepID=A0ABT6FDM2_9BACT|nr:hypothetical protein [Paludisphaera mucosa]MDG3005679.1 hypothetical protein [Paludisphaera mucosa]
MNKITLALAMGAGLVLSAAAPTAHATPIVQQLDAPDISASAFNSLFKPIAEAPPITAEYRFINTPLTGVVQSQVLEGTGAYAGVYAYAYQFGVKNVTDSSGEPTSVNSASLQFNATPTRADLLGTGGPGSAVFVVKDGTVGGLSLPAASPGSVVQAPSSIAWLPGDKTGALTFQYLDATKSTDPLGAGATSGTIVVLTTEKWTNKLVSLQNANPQIVYPSAYASEGGPIQEVPVPEPSTVLAWAGMIAAAGVVQRRRSRRAV